MRLLRYALFALACVLPAHAQPFPLPADVQSPEDLVRATYETIPRAPGANYPWDRSHSLFLPNALQIYTEPGTGFFSVVSPNQFQRIVDTYTTIGGPTDFSSPQAIVTAAYAAIQREPGQDYDWRRFRSLFLPQATLIPNTEQTGGSFAVQTPREFADWADSFTDVGGPNDQGFAEEEIHSVVHQYGNIAQVWIEQCSHYPWLDNPMPYFEAIQGFLAS